MKHIYNDGGRLKAGFKGSSGDCVTRAIAIATGKPYIEVYNDIFALGKEYAETRRDRTARTIKRKGASPRDGVYKKVSREYINRLGLKWTPTMGIGTGCKVHLKDGELPMGKLIVKVSKHFVAVIDGEIHDTFDCSREGTRCVYGYWVVA